MRHRMKITVLDHDPQRGTPEALPSEPRKRRVPCFKKGDSFDFWREEDRDDFYKFGVEKPFPCAEAWDCISRYVYTGLQGGAFMHKWTNDDRVMIACCNDGTRPVIFKLERIDIPEDEADQAYLATKDFSCSAEDAYTG